MTRINPLQRTLLILLLLLPCGSAWAQWELDNTRSVVNFVTVKNASVGEINSFSSLVGYIGAAGKVQLTISLDSVETLVPIRNERMRELLFETVQFPAATISAQLEPALLTAAAEGGVLTADVPITLTLHGHEKALSMPVIVVAEGDGRLRVFSARPVLVNAGDFGLEAGVAALQKIAGLQSISNAIPVTLHLLFVPAD
jgi:polyisoprenoid-binding protein YceI